MTTAFPSVPLTQEKNMNIRDYSPAEGQAFQGDVSIVPVPHGWAPARTDEVKPIDGRLILQEGEVTGHHHAVGFRDDALARDMAVAAALPTARLFRDPGLAARMAAGEGPLTRSDLVVGFLVVENGPVVVSHEEHDGIRLPAGIYCIGRQVESAGAEERRVAD